MSGPTSPGSPPPEVPEEFAAAYRAAYERAMAAQSQAPVRRGERVAPERGTADAEGSLPTRRGRLRIGTHSAHEQPPREEAPTAYERVRDSRWFVPALLALLVAVLVLGAYGAGRSFSDRVSAGQEPDADPSITVDEGGTGADRAAVTHQRAAQGAWKGRVSRVTGITASAGCTSEPGVDASGAAVSYSGTNLTDGVAGTTWRCDGTAVGEKITLDLGRRVPVAEVGLIPGYAKTDPRSGVDRYAENNRVTRVRWSIGQEEVEQSLDPSAGDRSLRLLRVPRTRTDTVTLEILAVDKGSRGTTAISEVSLGRAD